MSDSSGNDYYYLHDHLYSPAVLVEDDGTVVERYEYDAYGASRVLEPNFAPDPDGLSDYANSYLFTGRRLDILDANSLKIQYNRNRYYDPQSGRWLTHDPLGYVDTMNLYEYVLSQPVLGIDWLGMFWIEPINKPFWRSSRIHGGFSGAWMSVALFPEEQEKYVPGAIVERKYALWKLWDCCNDKDRGHGREMTTFLSSHEFSYDVPENWTQEEDGWGYFQMEFGNLVDGEWKGDYLRDSIGYFNLIDKEFDEECPTKGYIDLTVQFAYYEKQRPRFPVSLRPAGTVPLDKDGQPKDVLAQDEYMHLPWAFGWIRPTSGSQSRVALKVRITWDCHCSKTKCTIETPQISIATWPLGKYVVPTGGVNTRRGRGGDVKREPEWIPFD